MILIEGWVTKKVGGGVPPQKQWAGSGDADAAQAETAADERA